MAGLAIMPDISEYLTVEETAEALGYHVESVRRLLRGGKLKDAEKKAGVWLIPRDTVKEYREAVAGLSKHDPRRGD
jgi:excisionase family DNA binding protein